MEEIFHLKNYCFSCPNFKFKLDGKVLADKLLKAQKDLINQIIADCTDYVPFQQGILSNSVRVENGNEIVWGTPYARFQYMGKLMLDYRGSAWALKGEKKHVVNIDLEYSTEGHSRAGKKWFERAKKEHEKDWLEVFKKAVK